MKVTQLLHFLFVTLLILVLASCRDGVVKVDNEMEGKLTATFQLVEKGEKKFYLDAETAPRPPYMQLWTDSLGKRFLTFLNPYKNAIYFYNYDDTAYVNRIAYNKEGPNAILRVSGYYIKNADSIYIYNMPMVQVELADAQGKVKAHIPLTGASKEPDWPNYYPQYLLSTVTSFIPIDSTLILTGQSMLSVPAENMERFKFSAYINTATNQVDFRHTYPKEIYGNNANWEGGLPTQVFSTLSPNKELVFSFPASHNLYLTRWDEDATQTVYGGSNVARTIHSIDYSDVKKTPDELVIENYMKEDMYGAILYDPYRNVYYRFLLKGLPDATIKTVKEEKPIVVILMDEHFHYMGETNLGTGKEWNWTNAFVTQEGLNIEYIGDIGINEDYLTLKVLSPKALN